jgi:hypothetical protein
MENLDRLFMKLLRLGKIRFILVRISQTKESLSDYVPLPCLLREFQSFLIAIDGCFV